MSPSTVPEAPQSYSDEAIRKMLASTMLRSEVPPKSNSPAALQGRGAFRFKNVRTLVPGQAVMLPTAMKRERCRGRPNVLITSRRSPIKRRPRSDRTAAVETIPGIRDWRITNSEPMRISGAARL